MGETVLDRLGHGPDTSRQVALRPVRARRSGGKGKVGQSRRCQDVRRDVRVSPATIRRHHVASHRDRTTPTVTWRHLLACCQPENPKRPWSTESFLHLPKWQSNVAQSPRASECSRSSA